MKSAYELAMERLGGETRHFTPEQKEQLAEIDRKADAKIAQIRMQTDVKIATVSDAEAEQLRQDMAVEIEGLNNHREREKERLKKEFQASDSNA